MNPLVTTALLIVAGSFFGFTLFRRTAPLFALRSAGRTDRPGERWKGLVRFGFGQRRLLDREELYSGVLHVVLFGAFLVLALRTITLFGMGFAEDFHLPLLGPESFLGRAYLLAKDVLVLGALAASLALLWRRLVSRPDRLTLSFEGNLILAFIAGLMITDILFDGASLFAQGGGGSLCAPAGLLGAAFYRGVGLSGGAVRAVGLASFWSHLGIVLAFGNLLPYGKHFHILTALPNVYFRALSPGSGALRKLDLEREDPEVGTQSVKDITWKEALDVYSCTECGRCQTHCPTYLTGKPLSHKEVNRAIRRHLAEKAPDLIQLARARAGPDREPAAPLPALSDVVPPETFWACTTCGWCETACPVLIENIPRLIDLRRHKVLAEGELPEEAARLFRNVETQGNPWGIGSNRRAEWCQDLGIPLASEGKQFEYLFFVGCAGSFDDRQKKVSRALVQILREADVSFAILGEEETCNGEAVRRLGNEYLYQLQASANVELFERYRVKKVLVSCPHCLNTIRHELPRFGGHYEVVHHTELIARLFAEGRLVRSATSELAGRAVTFHDPCYLARYNGVCEAPRRALAAAGARPIEMRRNRRETFCCGAGGGRMWLEEKLGLRINQNRVEEAASTLGPAGGLLAVGCPFCQTMLRDGVNETGREETLAVLDVAEIVALGLQGKPG